MRSTIMMGTALLASMTVVGAFVPEAAAASRGAARPTFRAIPHQPAFRPMPYRPSTAFRTPARTVQRPNPNVRPRVLTSRDIHPKVPLLHSAPGSVAGRTPAAHPLPAHDRALVPHAPIPGVSARERAEFDHENRRERDEHHFRDWARGWDHDFHHRYFDGFGRLGYDGWRYFGHNGFARWGEHGLRHFGDHAWQSVWDHGFRPLGDLAFRPWWNRWWPANANPVASGRPYFGVLNGGGAPVAGDDN